MSLVQKKESSFQEHELALYKWLSFFLQRVSNVIEELRGDVGIRELGG
jgi:hypothetical protein